MKQILAFTISALFAIGALAQDNTVRSHDTFTQVKQKLAGGITSGTLAFDTAIDGDGAYDLTLENFNIISLEAEDELRLATPAIVGTTATTNQVLKLVDASTGKAEWGSPYALSGSATYNAPDLATNSAVVTTVTVTGAGIGDYAIASLSTVGTNGIVISAQVSATNTVAVTLYNATTASVNLDSGTLKAAVFR